MNLPREYKNPTFQTAAVIVVFLLIVFAFIVVIGGSQVQYIFALEGQALLFILLPIAALMGLLFLGVLSSMMSKTIVSNDEISSRNLFGTKTLKWSEITRVSGSGHAIKLHNFDSGVTVTPSTRLAGYEEVVELIGIKCPNLFNPQEHSQIRVSLLKVLMQVLGGLGLIGIGAFPFIIGDYARDIILTFAVVIVTGLVIIGMALFAPQSISIQGNSVVIGYLFTSKTWAASEISSINFGYSTTRRGGKKYYVQVSKGREGSVRFYSLNPGLPVAYLVLKNWHKQNVQNAPVYQAIQPN